MSHERPVNASTRSLLIALATSGAQASFVTSTAVLVPLYYTLLPLCLELDRVVVLALKDAIYAGRVVPR
jgi:hypothetical protein